VIGFDEDTAVWRAPGVLSLIGETRADAEGMSLSFGIETGCLTTVMVLDDPVIEIVSDQGEDPLEVKVSKVGPALVDKTEVWARPVVSVLAALAERGYVMKGLSISLDNSVDGGPDLAGAAGVRCSTAAAVSELLGKPLTLAEVVALARDSAVAPDPASPAEWTAVFCWPDQITFAEGTDLDPEPLDFVLETENLVVMVCDTKVRRASDDPSEVALRASCVEAARVLAVPALRELTLDHLDDALGRLPTDELRARVTHVVTENDRVLACAELIRTGQIKRIGALLNASHTSQRDDFGVSFPQAELAVSVMRAFGAAGARLAGRGGAVVGLMDPSQARAATIALDGAFGGRGYEAPSLFTVATGRGLHRR